MTNNHTLNFISILIERARIKFRYLIFYRFNYKYAISEKFKFNGDGIQFYGDGEIICGAKSYIGDFSTIQSYKNCKLQIGEHCQISLNVRIYTCTDIAEQDFSNQVPLQKTGDVIIEDFVWIAANVFINPWLRIGRNSIIGANSVVIKDVLENSIVGGVPSNLIRIKNI